jgi:Carboxypeptidase regulatory-like domain
MQTWVPTLVVTCWTVAAGISLGDERVTLTGRVADASGKPVEHATVLVYEAGVKKGYSIYCPTCWVDCGKHTVTDAEGSYTITGLSSNLLFTLLVVRDGYAATYVRKVNPANGPAETAVLKSRPPVEDVSQVVRGRVVDGHGDPLRDAVVEQQGVTYRGEGGRMGTQFGPRDWIDLMAVTNEKGEFEIAYSKPAVQMILQVRARAMAPKLFTEPTGADRKTMTVTDGATIRGRLVQGGKPIANAEVGLSTTQRRAGTIYSEFRIGTQEDGTFAITNVPAGRIWYLYPKMESLAARGSGADVTPCETKDDGQVVDIGDIQLTPAHILRGKVVLTDGKTIPPDMHVTLSIDRAWDSQIAAINPDGTFEFRGLPKGVYELAPGVKGYRLREAAGIEALVDHDVNDLVIKMEPGTSRP